MRASSRPCSFFAAWYSKFSERSPNSRAVLIACDDVLAARPFELGELGAQRLGLLLGELLAVYHLERPPLRRGRVDDARLRNLHAGLLEALDLTLQPRDARDVGLLLGQHERDPDAALAGATGAADTVRVDVGLFRRVEVDRRA